MCSPIYISFQKNINLLCLATCLGFVDITWTTFDFTVTASFAVILLCDHYNIATTGHGERAPCRPRYSSGLTNTDLMYYEKLTVSYLEGHTSWSKDLQQLPDIDISMVKQYLLLDDPAAGCLQPVYTSSSLRSYC